MKLEDLHDDVLAYVKRGEFAQGIEAFYAEDVTQQINNDPLAHGRDEIAKAEYEYQGAVTSLEKVELLARAIDDQGNGNGVVLYQVHMVWEHSEAGHVSIEQAVVENWESGKIKSIRFYGADQ